MNRILGYYVILVGIAIALQFTFEMAYLGASIKPLEVWYVLDWFSLVGFLICVGMNFQYMRAHSEDSLTWERFASNVAFYVSLGLLFAFLHNFISNIFADDDLQFWKFINVVQIPLFFATGFRLIK